MFDALFDALHSASLQPGDDAVRLFHGRGHCYPGLSMINIDWFCPVVWVVLYEQLDDAQDQALRLLLQAWAKKQATVQAVVVQKRGRRMHDQTVIYGELPEQCLARENGLVYQLNLADNRNIGFFMDAKPARSWVRQQAAGNRVLNLFAYTCSFSVAAMAGGAASVVNIDMARSALATGQRNHELNRLAGERLHFLPHDIFRSTRRLEKLGPYNLVIADPPSRQKGSFEADKDYARLLRKLKPMLADNAVILACLNAPYLDDEFLPQQFADNLPEYALQQRLPQRMDMPEQDPGRCLKMQVFAKC